MCVIAIFTALIETPIFYFAGYKNFRECSCFAAINIMSNLILNQYLDSMTFAGDSIEFMIILFISEIIIVLLEFALCVCVNIDMTRKLFMTLIFTNLASFITGLIYALGGII